MDWYLKLIGLVNGRRMHVIRDVSTMSKVLKQSVNKGKFLEHQLSKDNWFPAKSIESEDGKTWERLRRGFDQLFRDIPWRSVLPDIIKQVCQPFVSSHTVIDAKVIMECVIRIMFQLLFQITDLSSEEISFWIRARNSFAETLAIRGPANLLLKQQAFNRIHCLVNENVDSNKDALKHLKKPEYLSEDEWTSCFFQPWLM